MRAPLSPLPLGLFLWACLLAPLVAQEVEKSKPPLTGPETEKRFPPLKVPPGFRATLFACDPLIEYPSVMSAGPRPGAVFVAVDYMTGLGTEITRRSEVRLVEDTNADGYADKSTLYAGGFNSIMGLTYNDGTVFVMHAPFLTALRDTKGTGVADERKDIVTGLGLTPEENPVRLHCANGVTAGHDGWLYLALGDHGCIVNRPEGDRLVLEGGGILRCRPDGRDLHIFSTGLRNIYDVALDAELNVFVRDNENDGGDYKIRVCHSFFGADHGYPYLYYERPHEALSPLADLGLGSSAGGVCYLETQFPKEYHGSLFFCEWGKSLVRYEVKRRNSFGSPFPLREYEFIPPKEIEFALGDPMDPYGFKPTDVVVQRDGTLMVSDYADGQRPKRGRGRIYHIEAVAGSEAPTRVAADAPLEELLTALDSPSYCQRWEAQAAIEGKGEAGAKVVADALSSDKLQPRGRLHAIWIMAHVQQAKAIEPLLMLAERESDDRIRAQAIRAIADLADPVLINHRLDAGAGDVALAERLAKIGRNISSRSQLDVVIALGRLKWAGLADFMKNFRDRDPAVTHAAAQALRRTGNWPGTLRLLDGQGNNNFFIAMHALADIPDPVIVDSLIERLSKEELSSRRQLFADALTRVYKKPAPWVYWDYRPKPRPANTVVWERTEAIGAALDKVLLDSDTSVRVAVLKRMQREKIPAGLASLGKWLDDEWKEENVALLLAALRDHPATDIRPHLATIIREPEQSEANRLLALEMLTQGLEAAAADELLAVAKGLGDDAVLAALLRRSGSIAKAAAIPLLQSKLASPQSAVRAAAIEGLGELQADEGRTAVLMLLADESPLVRRAAATAAGKLQEKQAIDPLLKLAADADPLVLAASLDSLRILKEPRLLPLAVAALDAAETLQIALQCLRELGGPEHAAAVIRAAKSNPSASILAAAIQALTQWRERPGTTAENQAELDRAVADIQGASGSVIRWKSNSRYLYSSGTEGRMTLELKATARQDHYSAESSIFVAEPTPVEFLGTSNGPLDVWLDGRPVFKRESGQEFRIDSDRSTVTIPAGESRLSVRLSAIVEAPGEFQLRFRRKSATQSHEKLIAAALSRGGNIDQGKLVFQNSEKTLCLKCHRVQDQGEKTGPELTGLGSRFSRIYIAESILDPNRTIAPSFGTFVVRLASGQVVSGIKIAETETALTLVDNLAQKHVIAKADIEEQKTSPLSTMPEGLEKKLSESEFVDLVAFLAALKETKP
ncbi:MAG: DUF7133 domain-containing protein [Pirellulaceae bacterium]